MQLHILGIDIAASVFHLYGVNKSGRSLLRKALKRSEILPFVSRLSPTVIAMEVCSGSNYWGREFEKLGHKVKLISPQHVKPFVGVNKNDFNDARAITEAVTRPHIRSVQLKSLGQLDLQFLHRIRSRLVAQKLEITNQIRGFLAEYGFILKPNSKGIYKELPLIIEDATNELSMGMRNTMNRMLNELKRIEDEIGQYDGELMMYSAQDEECMRIRSIPGIGPITSTALVASIPDPKNFKNGRHFAAWLGLVPRQHSTGGQNRLGHITKRGDKYLRYLLVHGARSVALHAKRRRDRRSEWINKKINHVGFNKTVVAIANRNARVVWALLSKNEIYNEEHMLKYAA